MGQHFEIELMLNCAVGTQKKARMPPSFAPCGSVESNIPTYFDFVSGVKDNGARNEGVPK